MSLYNLEDYFTDTKEYLTYECLSCASPQSFEIRRTIRPYQRGAFGHAGQYLCRCVECGWEVEVEGKKQRLPKKKKTY